jgi:hypothetical protein
MNKTFYICIVLFVIVFTIVYFFYILDDDEHFKLINKFNFVSNYEVELEDNFGDITKELFQQDNIREYMEGNQEDKERSYIEKFTQQYQEQENSPKIVQLEKIHTPRNVWTYWENKGNRTEPYTHIQLCFDTMKKHYSKYNFIILNEETIKKYLPNLRSDLNELLIAQKVDYYRVALLEKYGGIWVDADTIALKNLDEVFEKLDNGYDFVGFGCTGKICFNGYPDPSNWVMGSRKNGILIKSCLAKLNSMLDVNNKNYKYFDLGKNVIWQCKDELTNYNYYHYSSEYDGTRDVNGKWVHTPNHLSETPTKLLNEDKAFFIILANYELMNDKNNHWFLSLNREQILNGKMWISHLYRKGLGIYPH